MAWPQPTDYHEAMQNPLVCFQDAELRQGQVEADALGLPRPRSGNFADVYRVHCAASGNTWAVKCFTRDVPGLQERYQAVQAHLGAADLRFTVDFHYLAEGIRVRGRWYPALKMRWVEGLMLNEFVRTHADRPDLLARLAHLWVKLARQLRGASIAHGDLQHGNVLLVPASKAQALSLRLIDYDGMYVPALGDRPSGELGHPNYQHPQRLAEATYGPQVDPFSHLVIYTALRCLAVGGPSLWKRHDNGENLLFREQDFRDPAGSALIQELYRLDDADVRMLVGHVALASRGRMEEVLPLEDLLADEQPLCLTAAQEKQLRALLGIRADRRPEMALAAHTTSPALLAEGPHLSASAALAPGMAQTAAALDLDSLPQGKSAPPVTPAPDGWSWDPQLHVLPSSALASAQGGRPCPACGKAKHRLNAACPHCGRIDAWLLATFSCLTLLGGYCLLADWPAWYTLAGVLAGLAGMAGLSVALGRVVECRTAPGSVGRLLAGIGVQPGGPRVCRRCTQERAAGWLACRHCSCIDLAAVVALGSFAVLSLLAALLGKPGGQQPGWWQTAIGGVAATTLLLGSLALLGLAAGVLEVSQAQLRLRQHAEARYDLPGVETVTVLAVLVAGVTLLLLNLMLPRPQVLGTPTPAGKDSPSVRPARAEMGNPLPMRASPRYFAKWY